MATEPDDLLRYARALSDLPPAAAGRAVVALLAWPPERARDVLAHLSDAALGRVIGDISPPVAAAVARVLPAPRRARVLERLSAVERARVQDRLRWPDGSLGAMAHDDVRAPGAPVHAALPLERALDGSAAAIPVHDDAGTPVGTVWRDEMVWLVGQRSAARAVRRAQRLERTALMLAAALLLGAVALVVTRR